MIQAIPQSVSVINQEQLQRDQEIEDLTLKDTCKEFEAVLTSLIMKEGLKSAKGMGAEEETDEGSETYMNLANEQMAYFIGKQGTLGLADMLYSQIKGRIKH